VRISLIMGKSVSYQGLQVSRRIIITFYERAKGVQIIKTSSSINISIDIYAT
jgi:hypothetical protein